MTMGRGPRTALAVTLLVALPAQAQQVVAVESQSVVHIPGGYLERGSSRAELARAVRLCELEVPWRLPGTCAPELFEHEGPSRRVYVSALGIDRTEVTQGAWLRCMVAGVCAPPHLADWDGRLSDRSLPVAGVTHGEALGYCAFVGGRLPTEAEWERAARGGDRRAFPWGWMPSAHLANHGRAGARLTSATGAGPDAADGFEWAAPVGAYPAATSPFGLVDVAGNVWEWTLDGFDAEAYARGSRVDPRGPDAGDRVVRGGSWRSPLFELRVTHRRVVPEGYTAPDLGFRCAYDEPRPALPRSPRDHYPASPP